jgi:general stress protein 26
MLRLEAAAPTTLHPMTAQVDGESDQGPIWFFTATDTAIAEGLGAQDPAIFTFTSKGQDIFATVHGHLSRTTDRATISRLGNPWVAAWCEGGIGDPKLAVLRFDPASAEIWRRGSDLLAGFKLMFGVDPKADFKTNVVKVSLD